MSIFEFDEELYKKSIREEGYEDGYKKGLQQGHDESRNAIEQKDAELEQKDAAIKQKEAEIEWLKKQLASKNI